MTEEDRTETALRSLRMQLGEVRDEARFDRAQASFLALATALALVQTALTATTWFNLHDDADLIPRTAWHQPTEINWFGHVAVLLLLGFTLASLLVAHAVNTTMPGAHWLLAAVGAVTAVALFVLVLQLDHDTTTAPGFWFTLLAVLGLALTHGIRGDALRAQPIR